jgi:membrane fusion protein (multidrug efflux system)
MDVAPGELTHAGPLLRLIDVSVLDAEMVFVDEALGQIATGDRVRLAVDRVGTEVDAEVTAIDSFVDPASNTFTVVAEVDNADLSLPSGLSCRVVAWPE